MTTIIFLIITLIGGFLYFLVLLFNYKKEKAEDPHAKIIFCKKILIISIVIGVLNVTIPLVKHFLGEESATKKDIKELKEELISKLFEPTEKEVENEIDKQFKAEFEKKKKRALEEYQKGISAYNSYNFITAISYFEKAIKIFAIPSFYIFRGNSYFLSSQFDKSILDYTEAIRLNQNRPEAYNNRGNAWSEKGDHDKAL